MKKTLAMSILFCTVLLVAACSNKDYYALNEQNVSIPPYTEHIKDQLYYIPHEISQADFPTKYQAFLNDFPHLEVIDVENEPSEDTHNTIDGVFIFTKIKEE